MYADDSTNGDNCPNGNNCADRDDRANRNDWTNGDNRANRNDQSLAESDTVYWVSRSNLLNADGSTDRADRDDWSDGNDRSDIGTNRVPGGQRCARSQWTRDCDDQPRRRVLIFDPG